MASHRPRTDTKARNRRADLDDRTMSFWAIARLIFIEIVILALTAMSTEVSTLCLSPVYGSIPSSLANSLAMPSPQLLAPFQRLHIRLPGIIAAFLAWLSMTCLSRTNVVRLTGILPIFGICVPTIQAYLFNFSSNGPKVGPIFTTLLTSLPLLYLSFLSFLDVGRKLWFTVGGVDNLLPIFGGLRRWQVCLTIVSYGFMNSIQYVASVRISQLIAVWSGTSALFSRFGLQAAISIFFATLERSLKRLAFVGITPLLHIIFVNPHLPLTYNTAVLNATLHAEGYSLVARQESLTGYISVLDNTRAGFRAMRCDHSLLGGEWLEKPKRHSSVLNEPIYAIFVMLEAVRLVEIESSQSMIDTEKHALIIGLGIGTAPSALIAHGVHTTTIEIDPVVVEFAYKYFNLPRNHTSIIGDAVEVVGNMQTPLPNRKTYDYIIHDVFTGSAEPIDLFTAEFLVNLRELLSPEGVIAINYAGDLLLPSALSAITTAMFVFPSCRLFRETPLPIPMGKEDYTNVVIFCRKSPGPFRFREAVESDFLGSPARRQHLVPQHEVDETFYGEISRGKDKIIRRGQTSGLEASQMRSAMGHWYVMRNVLPDVIWENW
ncbi:hypothetical protein N7G274_003314 [Stereocaulon virgatum]|uniref:PABS domain-containing protein n=1 Tax=Stereocaulon virgatum TaxID=373712 RepID=A0ABR4AEA4_9LECA